MMYKLIIVESPSKAVTIEKYLKDQGYKVIASKGHIRDLPVDELGIDINKNFEIHDVTIDGKEKVIKDIKSYAKDSTEIFLASDPDREGEKISQSIYEILPKKGKVIKRVKFNAVTKEAIEKAIKNAGDIDEKKCEAQKVRRILDRLVGYKISPILWNKIRSGLSAGRVQSVALRIIVEREEEIKAFVPETWFTIIVKFNKDDIKFNSEYFGSSLTKKEDLNKKEDAEAVLAKIKDKDYKIVKIDVKEKEQKSTPPFTTSKLQQEAAVKLGFDTKKTMQVAQKLYEGVFLREKGTQGLITYMRTDSVRIEPQSIEQLRVHIKDTYGDSYLPEKAIEHKNKKAGKVQDAHEAIRPTHIEYHPDELKKNLTDDEYRLYNLIYQKFISSQMKSAILEQTIVMLEFEGSYFKTNGTVVKFDGFKKAFNDLTDEKTSKKGEEEGENDAVLPKLEVNEILTPVETPKVIEKTTIPTARFNESTLVKELEDKGIGRPSTYSAIISNILSRTYVEKEKNRFKPTDLGDQVCRALVNHFPKEMDVAFTASVETALDQIEDGEIQWLTFVKEFWTQLEESLNKALLEMKKIKQEDIKNSTKIKCLKCGDGEYVTREGKNGKFLACSNYPVCKSTQNFEEKDGKIVIAERKAPEFKLTDKLCPKCESVMVLKKNREGKEFYSCSTYPKCNGTLSINSTGKKCIKCNKGEIVPKISKNKKEFWGCSNYPDCTNVYWKKEDVDKL